MSIDYFARGIKAAAIADARNRRERIALVCLQSLVTSQRWDGTWEVVDDAVKMADQLIAALNKKEEVQS